MANHCLKIICLTLIFLFLATELFTYPSNSTLQLCWLCGQHKRSPFGPVQAGPGVEMGLSLGLPGLCRQLSQTLQAMDAEPIK